MRTITTFALAAALSLAAFPASQAQDRGQRDQFQSRDEARRPEQTQRDDLGQARQQPRRQTRGRVTGEVVKTKRVDIRGTDRQHLVVLLKTDRGGRAAVDLGAPSRFGDALPAIGDRLTLDGRLVRIGDRSVIVAEQIHKGDRVVRLDHRSPFLRDRRGETPTARRDEFRGDRPERDAQVRRYREPQQPRERDQQRSRDQQQTRDRESHAQGGRQTGDRPAGLGVRLLSDPRGVRVARVIPGSPAAGADIRPGDVITSIGNESVESPQQVINTIVEQQPGERVTLTLLRRGQTQRVTVELAPRREAIDPSDFQ